MTTRSKNRTVSFSTTKPSSSSSSSSSLNNIDGNNENSNNLNRTRRTSSTLPILRVPPPPARSPTSTSASNSLMKYRDVRHVFESEHIAQVKKLSAETSNEIEGKRKALRQLVGDSYRDLLVSADSIIDMNQSAEDIKRILDRLSYQTDTLQLKLDAASGEHQRRGSILAARDEDQFQFKLGTQMNTIISVPELLWSSLSSHSYLSSTSIYFTAAHLYNSLTTSTDPKVTSTLAKFPIVKRQWSIIQQFPSKIRAQALERLSQPSITDHEIASALSSLVILNDYDLKQALSVLLDARTAAIKTLFASLDAHHKSISNNSKSHQMDQDQDQDQDLIESERQEKATSILALISQVYMLTPALLDSLFLAPSSSPSSSSSSSSSTSQPQSTQPQISTQSQSTSFFHASHQILYNLLKFVTDSIVFANEATMTSVSSMRRMSQLKSFVSNDPSTTTSTVVRTTTTTTTTTATGSVGQSTSQDPPFIDFLARFEGFNNSCLGSHYTNTLIAQYGLSKLPSTQIGGLGSAADETAFLKNPSQTSPFYSKLSSIVATFAPGLSHLKLVQSLVSNWSINVVSLIHEQLRIIALPPLSSLQSIATAELALCKRIENPLENFSLSTPQFPFTLGRTTQPATGSSDTKAKAKHSTSKSSSPGYHFSWSNISLKLYSRNMLVYDDVFREPILEHIQHIMASSFNTLSLEPWLSSQVNELEQGGEDIDVGRFMWSHDGSATNALNAVNNNSNGDSDQETKTLTRKSNESGVGLGLGELGLTEIEKKANGITPGIVSLTQKYDASLASVLQDFAHLLDNIILFECKVSAHKIEDLAQLKDLLQESFFHAASRQKSELEVLIQSLASKASEGEEGKIIDQVLFVGRAALGLGYHTQVATKIMHPADTFTLLSTLGFSNAKGSTSSLPPNLLELATNSISSLISTSTVQLLKRKRRKTGPSEPYQRYQSLYLTEYQSSFAVWSKWVSKRVGSAFHASLQAENWKDNLLKKKTWASISIEENLQELIPANPSAYVTSFLFAICQEISRIGAHTIDASLLCLLSSQVMASVVQSYSAVLAGPETELSEASALQSLFDVYYLSDVLSGRLKQNPTPDSRQQETKLFASIKSRIDPIDLAAFEPHIKSSVRRAYQRSSLLLGALISLNKIAPPTTSSTSTDTSQLLPLAKPPPRFTYLPISNVNSSSASKTTQDFRRGSNGRIPTTTTTSSSSSSTTTTTTTSITVDGSNSTTRTRSMSAIQQDESKKGLFSFLGLK